MGVWFTISRRTFLGFGRVDGGLRTFVVTCVQFESVYDDLYSFVCSDR